MASLALKFVPPDIEDLTHLLIYEAPAFSGPFSLIEDVTPVGTYPDYIDNYTTDRAVSLNDWFAISWQDAKGAESALSAPVPGNEQTPVGEITSRVRMRDSSIDERIVVQEAEAAYAYAFPGVDPYAPADLDYVVKRGLTNLTLAMCYLAEMAHAPGVSWTAGIVSLKTSDQAVKLRADSIKSLIASANNDLGLSFSMIAHLEDLEIAGGMVSASLDQSRLLLVEIR